MTNPTSNFNWQMPTNTDLVYQLPADFEVFGQAVDTSLADLKGGTTGQILSKNSNTDMDFIWIPDGGGFTYATYTPTFTGFTKGNATITARWAQSGKAVNVFLAVTLGNTSSVTGAITASLPATAAASAVGARGVAALTDSGVRTYTGSAELLSTTSVGLNSAYAALTYAAEEVTSSTAPFTWTTNDTFYLSFTYEAA